jgi:hypothetical protein
MRQQTTCFTFNFVTHTSEYSLRDARAQCTHGVVSTARSYNDVMSQAQQVRNLRQYSAHRLQAVQQAVQQAVWWMDDSMLWMNDAS